MWGGHSARVRRLREKGMEVTDEKKGGSSSLSFGV